MQRKLCTLRQHKPGQRNLTCISRGLLALTVTILTAPNALAQLPGVHYQYQGASPPGAIGQFQLDRGGARRGYYQPVEIRAPAGTMVSLAEGDAFGEGRPAPRRVGLAVGQVYRLRITEIPFHEGFELFPTIEVIDRTYPPAEMAEQFPIPVDLTLDEMLLALDGRFITRVIYLEDRDQAVPVEDDPQEQRWFEAGPSENPVQVADEAGRPLVMLRMGGRQASLEGGSSRFFYGSPPFFDLSKPDEQRANAFEGIASRNLPRPSVRAASFIPTNVFRGR